MSNKHMEKTDKLTWPLQLHFFPFVVLNILHIKSHVKTTVIYTSQNMKVSSHMGLSISWFDKYIMKQCNEMTTPGIGPRQLKSYALIKKMTCLM